MITGSNFDPHNFPPVGKFCGKIKSTRLTIHMSAKFLASFVTDVSVLSVCVHCLKKAFSLKRYMCFVSSSLINPLISPRLQNFQAERHMDAPAKSIFASSITHLLFMLCILMKILSHASAKKEDGKA